MVDSQVVDKWLENAPTARSSFDDLTHYQKVLQAVARTIELMEQIDEAIPAWPLPNEPALNFKSTHYRKPVHVDRLQLDWYLPE